MDLENEDNDFCKKTTKGYPLTSHDGLVFVLYAFLLMSQIKTIHGWMGTP